MGPSHRTSGPDRPVASRAGTWPPLRGSMKAPDRSLAAAATIQDESFEEHLDQHPEDHFLSPSTTTYQYDEYDSWSSDEEDDDDEDDDNNIAWNSGVTDFALFDSDRRRAREAGEELPQKWNDMLLNQVSALNRSLKRARAESPTSIAEHGAAREDAVPALTPDVSPHLADDLDVQSYHGQSAPRPIVPNYLNAQQQFVTIVVTPPAGESAIVDDDEDDDDTEHDGDRELRRAFFPSHASRRRNARGAQPSRPGLSRGSRTLSGKLHVWRRPSLDSHSVQEDVHAEQSAEVDIA